MRMKLWDRLSAVNKVLNREPVAELKPYIDKRFLYVKGENSRNLQRTYVSVRCYKAQKLSKLPGSLKNRKEYAELE